MNEPIVPGFYPDPSICRVGEDYYLATSSFEYTPGVPLFQSRDLITWTQIANILERSDQLDVTSAVSSLGVCAPTLRHHAGRYWMITTSSARLMDGHMLVHADDPRGPWSATTLIGGVVGIDPDLAWDDSGTCYVTWTSFDPACFGIVQAAVDLDRGMLLEAPRQLWSGSGLASPEGPHLIQRGEWWYLIVAEGGTERGHAVSVARSNSIRGPFEGFAGNPILSHRSTDHSVQNTGHADLVELLNGEWAMVYLGVRPRGGGGGFHVNGRETFIAGIEWTDEWPIVDENRYVVPISETGFTDTFNDPVLDLRWISPRQRLDQFVQHAPGGGALLAPTSADGGALCFRTRDAFWTAEISLQIEDGGSASSMLRLDETHSYAVEITAKAISVVAKIGPFEQVVASVDRPVSEAVTVSIRAVPVAPGHPGLPTDPDSIQLGYRNDGAGETVVLADLPGRYLSTEIAGGFTGRVVATQSVSGVTQVNRIKYTPSAV